MSTLSSSKPSVSSTAWVWASSRSDYDYMMRLTLRLRTTSSCLRTTQAAWLLRGPTRRCAEMESTSRASLRHRAFPGPRTDTYTPSWADQWVAKATTPEYWADMSYSIYTPWCRECHSTLDTSSLTTFDTRVNTWGWESSSRAHTSRDFCLVWVS